jgi:hypothetical protein
MEDIMKKKPDENVKTFSDLTVKSWFIDKDNNIKVGDSFPQILAGESQTLDVKEIFHGNPYGTWKIVVTKDDKIYLLKTSRELK